MMMETLDHSFIFDHPLRLNETRNGENERISGLDIYIKLGHCAGLEIEGSLINVWMTIMWRQATLITWNS